MYKNNDLLKLALWWLLCLALVAGCQKTGQPTPNVPQVRMMVDGQEHHYETRLETVGDLLDEVGVELGDLDRVEPDEYTTIADGLTIQIIRVQVKEVPGPERQIPYAREYVQDTSVPAGESRILEPGQNGVEQTIYRAVYENGVETERLPFRTITLQAARPEVVLVGARENLTPTPITGTVAFLSGNKEVGYNAWVMRGSSGAQRRLTSDGTLDTRVFALSPDGTLLLFTRQPTETVTATNSPLDKPLNSLWLIDTTRVNAAPVDLRVADVLWAGWSPDGKTIAYSTGEVVVSTPGWQAHNDLWTAELSDRRANGPAPGLSGLSAEAERSARQEPGVSEDLGLVEHQQVLAGTAGGAYFWWGRFYAWSPDRRYMAYAQPDSIGYIRLQDGKETELYRFAALNTYSHWAWVPKLSWAPDSRFLAAVVHGPSLTGNPAEDSQVFDIWVFDVERPLRVKQVSEAGMWAAPAWSPAFLQDPRGTRSSQIAYGRARSPYESANSGYDLYVMDRDGSNRQRIFPGEGDLGLKSPQVAWGPSGRQLITTHQDDLFLIDLDQKLVRRLTIDSSVQMVAWAR